MLIINNKEDLEITERKKQKTKCNKRDLPINKWSKISSSEKSNNLAGLVDQFQTPESDFFADSDVQNINWTPECIFDLFFDEEMVQFICSMTNNYAVFKMCQKLGACNIS